MTPKVVIGSSNSSNAGRVVVKDLAGVRVKHLTKRCKSDEEKRVGSRPAKPAVSPLSTNGVMLQMKDDAAELISQDRADLPRLMARSLLLSALDDVR